MRFSYMFFIIFTILLGCKHTKKQVASKHYTQGLSRLKQEEIARRILQKCSLGKSPISDHFGFRNDSLVSLIFYREDFDSLPAEIGHLNYLEKLQIHQCKTSYIPDAIGTLRNLKWLRISGNPINELPASIGKLEKLDTLLLDKNKLNQLPEELGNLNNVTVLWLQHNNLTSIPETVWHLKSLRDLRLHSNNLTSIPISVSLRDSLKLYIGNNYICTQLPNQLVEWLNKNAYPSDYWNNWKLQDCQ